MPPTTHTTIPINPAKRVFDIVFSMCLLAALSPVIGLFLLLIALEHTLRLRPLDPLFYTEIRWSQGRPFSIIKFNIFKQNVIEDMRRRGEFIHTKHLEHNGSLLWIGWLLKQIYLDELPQLINVLKGDMSLVGPRPVNSEVRAELLREGNNAKECIKAGMTGLYQATHKIARGGRPQDELDRELVAYYATHPWYRILLYDLLIITKTLGVLVLAKGI